MMQRQSLSEIRTTLHRLWNQLPAIKARCTEEVVGKHLKLIAYYQDQYDRLVEAGRDTQPIEA